MTKIARQALSVVAVLACAMGMSAPANAVFVARICNDLQCAGGDDVLVQDNAVGDLIGMTGAISFATSAFGYTLEVNTSQSKPVIGSATAPQLDLSFVVTGSGAGNVFLYASDTDFLSGGQFALSGVERLPCSAQARIDRVHVRAEHLGDLGHRHLFELRQHEHLALLLRELHE